MNTRKVPALVLAAVLQVLPMARVACVNQAVAPTGFAIVMRFLAGTVALLGGSYHAVGAASAAIQGVAAWTKITNGVQAGPVTATTTGTAGQPLLYKIIITTPATTGAQNDYYYYDKLPPGLTMNTNVGGADGAGNGFIEGTPSQSGSYSITLFAGNTLSPQAGVVSKIISMTVSGGSGATPPAITGPPVNQTVTAGANVSFSVTATGTAPLSYSWKFNSVAITGATASTLQLTNVQTASSGTYSVTVSNSAGSTNASATLTVNAAAVKPSIITQPLSLTVSNGAPASFSVTAGGTAPLSYQWLKGASTIANATNSIYSIAAVGTNDAAGYSVVITNSAGSMTSSVATLTVLLPPSILTPPQSVTVSNGATASFSVVASGSAPLTYQWALNGGALAGATSSSLTITNAQVGNQGDYTVIVSNAVASITSPAAHLTVQSGTSPGPLKLSNPVLASGSLSFDVTGPSQTNYVFWTSKDLFQWSALKTNFSASGSVHFTETNPPSPVQFYRVTLSP